MTLTTEAPTPIVATESDRRTAWAVVALLVPVVALNYLDRQMLATMKLSVMADIPSIAKEEHWGFMLGSFKWVYACLSPIAGYVADRFGRRLTICGSLFAWSAVTWWTGHVQTYHQLLLARSCMGLSEAFYIPAALALITDHHAGPTRSRAVGVHQLGIYLGQILGGFGGYAAESPAIGWRRAFDACGVLGIVYSLPLLLLLRGAPRRNAYQASAVMTKRRTSFDPLLLNGSFLLLVLCFTLPALAGWIVRDWMPAVLQRQFNVSQGRAGVSASLYWQLAAIAGALVGGWLADRLSRRTIRGRIYVSAAGIALLIPAMFGVGNAATLSVAVAFLVLFGLGWGFFDCNNMPILCQIARPDQRATGYGLMNFVSISCGGLADWAFGTMRDRHLPLNVTFSFFAYAAAAAVVLMLFIRPRVGAEDGNLARA